MAARVKRAEDIAGLVFAPPEIGDLTMMTVEETAADPNIGVPLYVNSVDGYFKKMRAGQLISVIGRPSNGKSILMQYVARNEAMRIAREGRDENEYVALMTWEQAVEEMTLFELAAATGQSATDLAEGVVHDYEKLKSAAIERGGLPLWIFGHSVKRRRRRPRMTMTDAGLALAYVEDEFGLRPSLIVLDYLQRIAPEPGMERDPRMMFSSYVDRAKDMALAMGCPVILGVQAKRDVDDRKVKLPMIGDGQETSNIEQTSDRVLTVWMPKTSEPVGSELPKDMGIPHRVTETMMILSVAKQKMGPGGQWFPLYVDPPRNFVGPLAREIRR